jgi:hypothetical protein
MPGRSIHCYPGNELGEGGAGKRPILGGGPRSGSTAAARRVTAADMKNIIKKAKATDCEAYREGVSRFGGTCRRVTGPSLDEITTSIGVEVYVDHLGKRMVIATVF